MSIFHLQRQKPALARAARVPGLQLGAGLLGGLSRRLEACEVGSEVVEHLMQELLLPKPAHERSTPPPLGTRREARRGYE